MRCADLKAIRSASALLANGYDLLGRSFKSHDGAVFWPMRRRAEVLVTTGTGIREHKCARHDVPLTPDFVREVKPWPTLALISRAIKSKLLRLFPAGSIKTSWPAFRVEMAYEL